METRNCSNNACSSFTIIITRKIYKLKEKKTKKKKNFE